MNTWKVKRKRGNAEDFAYELNSSVAFAKVLEDKEIFTVDNFYKYINPSLKDISNFKESKDLVNACKIVKNYVEKNEKILLFSDYDCDGVTSTTIMFKGLKEIFPNINLEYLVGHRIYDGYGLSIDKIKEISKLGCKLLITLDNGITSVKEVDYANSLGMEVIILDHHEVQINLDDGKEILPKAKAIIDSKQSACKYKFKELCTAGLAYLFVHFLASQNAMKLKCSNELLQFAAIGTIVDIVELTKDNRIIAKRGINSLNKEIINKGLMTLYKKLDSGGVITSNTIGFKIGPCINAIGRIDDATKGIKLFLSDDESEIILLAEEVFNANVERKKMTNESIESVEKIIEENGFYKDNIIVVYDENIHESLAGNVASRVKDKYNKPTFVITKGHGCAKGSARGIEAYDLVEAMTRCKEHLLKFGGHKLAGGFSLEESKIFDFRKSLNDNANLCVKDFEKVLSVNKILKLDEATYELQQEVESLEPFGKGNDKPIFASLNMKIVYIKLDDEKKYYKLELQDDSINYSVTAISFGQNQEFKNLILSKYSEYESNKIFSGILRNVEIYLDMVYNINVNDYNGNKSVQLRPLDIRLSNMN
ncbi:MAG: single-stranded-DNA-specific exonuclease RecJ [Lachnospirales bacterium]